MKKRIRKFFKTISFFVLILFVISAFQYDENNIHITNKNIKFDPLYTKQWYLTEDSSQMVIYDESVQCNGFTSELQSFSSSVKLGIADFWKSIKKNNCKHLTIAIIDTCVDIDHEDLKSHIWKNMNEIPQNGIDDDGNGYIDDYYGWNFCENNCKVQENKEEASHGTHCAGIIAADHNGIGVMGILGNTNVKLMILPISVGEKDISSDNLISAIKYADMMGADICNISGVFLDTGEMICEAIKCSTMYFVVSAGNYENKYIHGLNLNKYKRYPACCDSENIITVGSINANEEISTFSNYSDDFVDIAAPGENIFSTLPDSNYGYESGTSMAAPIVTGILGAYYYSYTYTIEEAAELLFLNSKENSYLNGKVSEGRIVKYVNMLDNSTLQ